MPKRSILRCRLPSDTRLRGRSPSKAVYSRMKGRYVAGMGARRTHARIRNGSNGEGEAQPRPALGRRPWFAFLRRARSLRRFALAMRRQSVTGPPLAATSGLYSLETRGWRRGGVRLASTSRSRRRGLRPDPYGAALLFPGAVVHTFGMRSGLDVVGLDRTGRVVAARSMRPRRIAALAGASWVLELPAGEPLPRIGARLVVRGDLT